MVICLQYGRPGFHPWVGKIPWKREWLPTPVFWPGEFHRQRSLAGYSLWGRKGSDTTEQLNWTELTVVVHFFYGCVQQRVLQKYSTWSASLVAQMVKNLPAKQETWVWSLGQEVPLEKGMATHSSILAWRIQWTEKLGRLQSMGSQRVRHEWATSLSLSAYF